MTSRDLPDDSVDGLDGSDELEPQGEHEAGSGPMDADAVLAPLSPLGDGGSAGAGDMGTRSCDTRELCDSLDNDCDDRVDEDFAVDAACIVGLGECGRSGVVMCQDGGLGTVCSSEEGPPGDEMCNGKDDDCDGLVDFFIEAGVPQSACRCETQPLLPTTAKRDPGEQAASPSQCSVEPSGLVFSNADLGACINPRPWAQCILESAMFNLFDADHEGKGVLEVRFCLSAHYRGALNLYYGAYPRRKQLQLITEQEQVAGLAAACYVRYFAPQDALCPRYDAPAAQDAASQLSVNCRKGCRDGRWGDEGPDCVFDYDNTLMYATAESCRYQVDTTPLQLSNLKIAWLDTRCVCTSTAPCLDLSRPHCDHSARLPHTACTPDAGRCAGICAP